MINRKPQKRMSRSKDGAKHKILSPNLLKAPKIKQKIQHKQSAKLLTKKPQSKTQSRLKQTPMKNSLFNSLQDLPVTKKPNNLPQKLKKKPKVSLSSKNLEDSTASRDFKNYVKQFNQPNGEYFGSILSGKDDKKQHKKHASHSRDKNSGKEHKKVKSLQKKIKCYRRMSSLHKSQSQSLKSEISQKQMRRLQKMQSIEKKMVMEEILSIEEKRLHLGGVNK